MLIFKKSQDLKNLPDSQKLEIQNLSEIEKAKRFGAGCVSMVEPIPEFNKAQCEKIFEGENNSQIVLGRDRSGPIFKDNGEDLGPYGSKGHTNCGMIDIVAGRHSKNIRIFEEIGSKKSKIKIDPDFSSDASRIYISQKTDIDTNFNIGKPENRKNESRSAIGLKSDNIRIIARETLKLVTGTDSENSLGGKIYKVDGIELIAGNDESKLQYIPKGENLVECLNRLTNHLSSTVGIIDAFVQYQMRFNDVLLSHTHISPFYGLDTTQSKEVILNGRNEMLNITTNVMTSLTNMKINLTNFKSTYLEPSGNKFINSKFNKVN